MSDESICGHRGKVNLTLEVIGRPSDDEIHELIKQKVLGELVEFTAYARRTTRCGNQFQIKIKVQNILRKDGKITIIGFRGSKDIQNKHVITYLPDENRGVCEVFK